MRVSKKSKLNLGEGLGVNVALGQRMKEALDLTLTAIAEDEELNDEELEPACDPLEPHEVQELGFSESIFDETDINTDFEDPDRALVPWFTLSEFARPPVRFWIDDQGGLGEVGRRQDCLTACRRAVALAIRRHLQPDVSVVSGWGGWCQVPAIGSLEKLLSLAAQEGVVARSELEAQAANKGKHLTLFGILLPSGEVITPKALVMPASRSKRATLAGALRLASSRPNEIAGEIWTEKDWARFEHSQNASKGRKRSSELGKKRL